MTRFNRTYLQHEMTLIKRNCHQLPSTHLNSFIAPSHYLPGADVRDRCRHLAPLQNEVFRHSTHRVDVDAFVVVAQQKIHAVRVGKCHDAVRRDWSLSLKRVDLIRIDETSSGENVNNLHVLADKYHKLSPNPGRQRGSHRQIRK